MMLLENNEPEDPVLAVKLIAPLLAIIAGLFYINVDWGVFGFYALPFLSGLALALAYDNPNVGMKPAVALFSLGFFAAVIWMIANCVNELCLLAFGLAFVSPVFILAYYVITFLTIKIVKHFSS